MYGSASRDGGETVGLMLVTQTVRVEKYRVRTERWMQVIGDIRGVWREYLDCRRPTRSRLRTCDASNAHDRRSIEGRKSLDKLPDRSDAI